MIPEIKMKINLKKVIYPFYIFFFLILSTLNGQTPGTLRWKHTIGENFLWEIGNDNDVYILHNGELTAYDSNQNLNWNLTIGDSTNSFQMYKYYSGINVVKDDTLISIDSNGQVRWRLYTETSISDLNYGKNDYIYYTSANSTFYAIDSNGIQIWQKRFDNSYLYDIRSDGRLFFSIKNNLYVYTPEGNLLWSFDNLYFREFSSGRYRNFKPAFGYDNTTYVLTGHNEITALNNDGTIKWRINSGYYAGSNDYNPPKVGPDNTIYFTVSETIESSTVIYPNQFRAVDSDGVLKWNTSQYQHPYMNVTRISESGLVYTKGEPYPYSAYVYAFDYQGLRNGFFGFNSWGSSELCIGSNGIIYITTALEDVFDNIYEARLYAFSEDGHELWYFSTQKENVSISTPVMGTDGTIFFSCDSSLYAIYSESTQEARYPWKEGSNIFSDKADNFGLYIKSESNFAIKSPDSEHEIQLTVYNPSDCDITLGSISFDNSDFKLNSSLPAVIQTNGLLTLSISFPVQSSNYYKTNCQYSYSANGIFKIGKTMVSAGVFIDDGSELAYTAKEALESFTACYEITPYSVASMNNKGVLYRLLGEYDISEKYLMRSVGDGLNEKHGYAGIIMNIGVLRSDQILYGNGYSGNYAYGPNYQYERAEFVSDTNQYFLLEPKLIYNRAWESYHSNNIDNSITLLTTLLSTDEVPPFLKAKAQVLRGACHLQLGNYEAAKSDFENVVYYDPYGPMRSLAEDYLASFNNFNVDISVLQNPVLTPFIDIYAISQYSLSNIEGQIIIGDAIHNITFEETTSNTFKSDFQMSTSGNASIRVMASNLGGHDSTLVKDFYVQMVNPKGVIAKYGPLTVDFPSNTSNSDFYSMIIPVDEKQLKVKKIMHGLTPILSYTIGPVGKKLNNEAKLIIDLSILNISTSDYASLKIFRKTEDHFIPLLCEINEDEQQIMTSISTLGTFSLAIDQSVQSVPTQYKIYQNYPNPFNSNTTIHYELPENGQVEIAIFNMAGQLVKSLVNDYQDAGYHQVGWDSNNYNGIPMPSGLYFLRLISRDYQKVIKLVLVR